MNKRRVNGKETPTYKSWKSMKSRCKRSEYYKGQNITYCKEWESFDSFYNDMGERLENTTLDRIDPTKGYSKDNCRWASTLTQARNKKYHVRVKYNNKYMLLVEACDLANVPYYRAWRRLKKGDPIETVLGDSDDYKEKIFWNGEYISYSKAAILTGISRKTLQNRIKISKWSVDKAMTTPVKS